MSPTTFSRVVLVGFMGSGKTEVGRVLARRLGWRFIDFDEAIEAEAGMSVAAIFETHGEGHFRKLEERVARKLLAVDEVVLASGGGWAAEAGRLDELPAGTETFWLDVPAEEAVRRVSTEPGRRPLLARSDAEAVASRLLDERSPRYARADWTVDTVGLSVEDVADRVLRILKRKYPQTRTE